MQYYSTRNHAALFSLQEAAFRGLAPDGGLFMPAVIPHADLEKVRELSECSFSELSRYLTGLFFGDELPEARTDAIAAGACRFPVPLKQVGKDKYTLELFHGPTFAFKDIGAGFMGHALRELNRTAGETIILTATSGDTGSAVANGFYGIEGVKVVILYPDGQVSGLQESQMTTLGGNIFPLKVKGTFDDCQRIVKDIFSDADFRREKRVTSANSINILRWIPQSFYYFHGWAQWVKATDFLILLHLNTHMPKAHSTYEVLESKFPLQHILQQLQAVDTCPLTFQNQSDSEDQQTPYLSHHSLSM